MQIYRQRSGPRSALSNSYGSHSEEIGPCRTPMTDAHILVHLHESYCGPYCEGAADHPEVTCECGHSSREGGASRCCSQPAKAPGCDLSGTRKPLTAHTAYSIQ